MNCVNDTPLVSWIGRFVFAPSHTDRHVQPVTVTLLMADAGALHASARRPRAKSFRGEMRMVSSGFREGSGFDGHETTRTLGACGSGPGLRGLRASRDGAAGARSPVRPQKETGRPA